MGLFGFLETTYIICICYSNAFTKYLQRLPVLSRTEEEKALYQAQASIQAAPQLGPVTEQI